MFNSERKVSMEVSTVVYNFLHDTGAGETDILKVDFCAQSKL